MRNSFNHGLVEARKRRWESNRIEYKCCRTHLSKDIWETVSSFANEGGGLILLGYKKRGDSYILEGVENPAKIIDDFTSTVGQKFNFCPVVNAEIIEEKGKYSIIIEVKEALVYQKPIYLVDSGPLKGGYKRVGASDIRLNDEDVARYYRERLGAPDSQPAEDVTLDDIDERALAAFKNLRRLERPDAPELTLDDRGLLRAYRLIYKDTVNLTIGGLLLFGKEDAVRGYFPALRLDIIRIKGTKWGKDRDPFLSRDLTGNLIHLRVTAMEIIDQFFLIPFHADERGDRIEENAHRRALREALTNLLMHQNYYHRSPAQIRIYNDRIEFYNPGHSLKDPSLFDVPGSELRNPSIASVFYSIGWAEAKGTGLLSTRESLIKEGYPVPQLINDTPHDTFTLILPHPFTQQVTPQDTQQVETTQQVSASAQRRGKKQISQQVTPQDTQQVEATQQVSPSAQRRGKKQISHQVTPQDTQQVETTRQVSKLIAQRADITDKRAIMLKFCESPRTLKEIMSFLRLKDRNNFTGKILNPLLQSNYILRTIPGKPKSRLQKYVTNISNRVSGSRSEL